MSGKGYIRLHRQLQDCWIWQGERFSRGQAWVDLLMMANHKDVKIPFGDNIEIVKRGQFITSIAKLSDKWMWSFNTVKNFLRLLENDNMLIRKSDNRRTLITIVNYEVYQYSEDENDDEVDRPVDRPTDRPIDGVTADPLTDLLTDPLIPNNNDNNDNTELNELNENNYLKRKEISKDISKREKAKFIPPTVEEVKEYCLERGNNIDPEYFVAFYESKGWMVGKNKMKNWKMAIITWEKNDNSHKDSSSGSAYIDAIKNRVTQVDDWV